VTTRRPHLRIARAGDDEPHNGVAIASAIDGESLLRSGGLDALSEALSRARGDTAWTHFWRGYVLQFKDLALARAEWLAAERGFEHDHDSLGLELSACGLVQCALLDNLSYVAFDARAARVGLATSAESAEPLTLFRVAARLLLASERRDATRAFDDDIDRAFTALGSGIEPEIALRVGTAALPLLGLGLERVRSDDFIRAGAAVSASPQVGDYSRALWHVCVVDSRFYDATWSARLHGELAAIDRLAASDVLRSFRARAHMLRAALALGAGDTTGGRASLDAAHPLLHPAHPRDYWTFHYFASRHALMVGQLEDAWEHAQSCHRKQIEACVPGGGRTTIMMQEGFVLAALGKLDEAAAAFARAGALSVGAQATPCLVHVHLSHALVSWRRGAHDEARAELTVAFAHARSIALTHFFRALPQVASELCGAALQLEADGAFARKAITARALACPDISNASWPWPLRVRTLGGLAIERDGVPVKFSRKAPKRLLDLLRLVIVLGGRHADLGRVAATLWPEAGGEEARDALKAMLHRTRALLGDEVLVVRDNQIAFDERVTWLDTWALEHVIDRIEAQLRAGIGAQHVDDGELENRRVQLLSLYRGHLFGEAETPFWALALRDRLRARFIRSVDALGQRLECTGRAEDAIAMYRAGLEHDNLAEELYQRLIACHLARGEPAQALNTYRRCRELLSIVLSLKPSARTEALVGRIAGSRDSS
jgi:DNA-binding SARP family transcriptional activator